MSKLVEVTMLVPIRDINITESIVICDKGDRHTPSGHEVSVDAIEVKGLDYEITDFDEPSLVNKAIAEWESE